MFDFPPFSFQNTEPMRRLRGFKEMRFLVIAPHFWQVAAAREIGSPIPNEWTTVPIARGSLRVSFGTSSGVTAKQKPHKKKHDGRLRIRSDSLQRIFFHPVGSSRSGSNWGVQTCFTVGLVRNVDARPIHAPSLRFIECFPRLLDLKQEHYVHVLWHFGISMQVVEMTWIFRFFPVGSDFTVLSWFASLPCFLSKWIISNWICKFVNRELYLKNNRIISSLLEFVM